MWAANRSYLRALRYGDPLERTSPAPLGAPQAAVPIRLLDRIGAKELALGAAGDNPDRSRRHAPGQKRGESTERFRIAELGEETAINLREGRA